MPVNIQTVIDKIIKKKDFNNSDRNKYEDLWEKKIDKEIKKNAHIVQVKKDKIIIKTKNPSWRIELTHQKEMIKQKLLINKKKIIII